MNLVYLLIGGNLGYREGNLSRATQLLIKRVGTIVETSSIYETAAWGVTGQSAFLNQVVKMLTAMAPHDLLKTLLDIETEMGRIRIEKMGPRTIDLDILFYEDRIVTEADLIIPHPQMAARRFVLVPLNEIEPLFLHPVYKKTVEQLLQECPDTLTVDCYTDRKFLGRAASL